MRITPKKCWFSKSHVIINLLKITFLPFLTFLVKKGIGFTFDFDITSIFVNQKFHQENNTTEIFDALSIETDRARLSPTLEFWGCFSRGVQDVWWSRNQHHFVSPSFKLWFFPICVLSIAFVLKLNVLSFFFFVGIW